VLLGSGGGGPTPRLGPNLGGCAIERDECPSDLPRRISPEFAESTHEHLLFIGRSADPL
jgi:hypothetical protein